MKKTVLIVAVVLIVLGGLIGGYYLSQKQGKSSLPISDNKTTEKLPSKTLKDYKDEAGFTISYPDDLSIEVNESSDSSIYADLTFTSKDMQGNLRIIIADTRVKTLDEYISESFDENVQIGEASLGGLPAKEVDDGVSITIFALDQGVLFSIATILEDEKKYWTAVHSQVVDSFEFERVEQTTSGGSSAPSGESSDVIFEGEVVIE